MDQVKYAKKISTNTKTLIFNRAYLWRETWAAVQEKQCTNHKTIHCAQCLYCAHHHQFSSYLYLAVCLRKWPLWTVLGAPIPFGFQVESANGQFRRVIKGRWYLFPWLLSCEGSKLLSVQFSSLAMLILRSQELWRTRDFAFLTTNKVIIFISWPKKTRDLVKDKDCLLFTAKSSSLSNLLNSYKIPPFTHIMLRPKYSPSLWWVAL